MEFAEQMFRKFDKLGKNALTNQQALECLSALGSKFSESEIQMLINTFDDNSNGILDFTEFKKLVHVMQEARVMNVESIMFYAADDDQNGYVDMDEFMAIMHKLKVPMPDDKLKQFAKKLGGEKVEITYDRFAAIVKTVKDLQKK
ncbi:Calmodulin [Hexamita inflata]|uniref:Calmodulin n=1 Tax=Hexamita inflata TaxID=28002 RepID=A0AA86N8R3_9EUKA|nr:Calmodulin [Hexamita inflata]